MKPHRKTFEIIALLAAVILSNGCATIFGGRTNSMVFTGEGEASVFIDDSLVGQAPGKIVLPKHIIQHGSVLEIRSDGKETQEYLILRKAHPEYIVADFIVGGIPLIFDTANGNILRPSPRKFDLNPVKPE